jgi:predicted DNA-binding transcriptional regulator AlpA
MEKLVDLKYVAQKTGLARVSCYNVAREKGFPDPKMVIGTVKLFDRAEIDRWLKARNAARAAKRNRAA